jgi:hypothetical protein
MPAISTPCPSSRVVACVKAVRLSGVLCIRKSERGTQFKSDPIDVTVATLVALLIMDGKGSANDKCILPHTEILRGQLDGLRHVRRC